MLSLGERIGAPRAGIAGRLADGLPNVRVSAYAAVDEDETYLYIDGGEGTLPEVGARVAEQLPGASVRVLHRTLDLPGASSGQDAPWHYIVETDVLPEAEADLNAWYDQEPARPGRRARHRARAAPRMPPQGRATWPATTCTRETFGSPPWLAVRATDWSSRVRPSFRNTRRTMFARIL